MESLNVGQISLLIEMIIYNQKCCKINTFSWPLEKLKLQQKKIFLINSMLKLLKRIFWLSRFCQYFLNFLQGGMGCECEF